MTIVDETVQNEDEEEKVNDVAPADPLITIPVITPDHTFENPLSTKTPSKRLWLSRFSGIFYTLLCCCLFITATFIIKQLGVDQLDAFLFRFFVQTIITFLFVKWKHYKLLADLPRQRVFQLLCCLTGAGSFVFFFVAVRYAELSDVTTLNYTRVVWSMVLSVIVYRERPSVVTLIALPLTLLGVVFVTQPSFLFSKPILAPNATLSSSIVPNELRMLGYMCAFGGALTSALNVILFKQLISTYKNIKPSVLSLQYATSVFIFLVLNQLYKAFIVRTSTLLASFTSWQYLLAAGICLMTILPSILTQKAIKREHPAVFSLLGSADIIVALILQNIFTSVRSNLFALLGSALVIGSVLIIGVSRIVNERRLQTKTKTANQEAKRAKTDEENGTC